MKDKFHLSIDKLILKSIIFIQDNYKALFKMLICLMVVSLYSIIANLRVDNSLKIWFSDQDDHYLRFLDFQDKYGNDDVVSVLVNYPSRIYEEENIRDLLSIEAKLKSLSYVDQVYSFASAEVVKSTATELSIERVTTTAPSNQREQMKIIERVNSSPVLKRSFIFNDGMSHLIQIRLSSFVEIELERDNIVRDIQSILDQSLDNYQLGGLAVLNEALNRTVAEESSIYSLISYLAMAVLLAIMIKKRRFLIIALAAIFIPMILCLGLFAATGYDLNMIVMTLPTILMVYALADVVHVINNYQKYDGVSPTMDKRLVIQKSMHYSFTPCFFASVTTMLAYLSFYTSSFEVLKTTGLFAFVGLGIAFLCVYMIAIIGFMAFKKPQFEGDWKWSTIPRGLVGKLSGLLVRLTACRVNSIVLCFILVSTGGLILLPNLEINTYPGEYLNEGTRARQDGEMIEKVVGGYLPFEIIVRSKGDEKITSLTNLQFLEKFQDKISEETPVFNPISIVEVVKYLNQQLTVENSYALPVSGDLTSQLLLLYEMDENHRLRELTDFGYREARITGTVKLSSAKEFGETIKHVERIFKDLAGDSRSLFITPQGYLPLYVQMVNYITSSLLYSFLGAFVMMALLIYFFARRIIITGLCLACNLIPLFTVVILMSAFKIPLDMGTVMIAAIMLGIAVDDTIHLIHAYQEERKFGRNKSDSIDNALKNTLPALLTSSIALVVGFLIIGLSSVQSLKNFSNLCAATVCIALMADVILLPTLIKLIDRHRPQTSV